LAGGRGKNAQTMKTGEGGKKGRQKTRFVVETKRGPDPKKTSTENKGKLPPLRGAERGKKGKRG